MPESRVRVKDPLGVTHAYVANAPTVALAETHLEAKIKVVVGIPVSASTSDTATDAENDTIVMSADTVWGDLNLEFERLTAQKRLTRNMRINEVESLVNAFGKPNLLYNKLVLVQNRFTDGNGDGGWTLIKAKWEKKFSNR